MLVDLAVMSIGPAVAIPAAVKAAGIETRDLDLFEINEVSPLLCLVTVALLPGNWQIFGILGS